MPYSRIPDDLKLCNCAGCGKPLLAPSEQERVRRLGPNNPAKRLEVVARRVNGRPYCKTCAPPPPKWAYRSDNGHHQTAAPPPGPGVS